MMQLFSKFKAGQPSSAVPAKWYNDLAAWFNNLRGEGVGCQVDITKPENPSDANPPVIRVRVDRQQAGAQLADAEETDDTPLKDAETAAVGESTKAARADHEHPVNIDTNKPKPDGYDYTAGDWTADDSGVAGDSHKYADRRHSHPIQILRTVTPCMDCFDPDPEVWTYKTSGAGDAGHGKLYSAYDHSHPFNAPTDATQTTYKPWPVGTKWADMEYNGVQYVYAASWGDPPLYAAFNHVHPDRIPVVYGTNYYNFRYSSYASGRDFAAWERSADQTAFHILQGEKFDIPIITRVSVQYAPVGSYIGTGLMAFQRILTFDYTGRLCAVGKEAGVGFFYTNL